MTIFQMSRGVWKCTRFCCWVAGATIWVIQCSPTVSAAQTTNCTLKEIHLETVRDITGSPLLRANLNGTEKYLDLGISAPWSLLYAKTQKDLGLGTEYRMESAVQFSIYGQLLSTGTHVKKFGLGALDLENMLFLVQPDPSPLDLEHDARSAGTIGANILREFDLDLDLSHNQLGLITQDHCPGDLVYWAKEFDAIPLEIDRFGQVAVTVQLNGVAMKAGIGGGEDPSMTLEDARSLFGILPGQEGVELGEPLYGLDGSKIPRYRRRFDSLAIGGIIFRHPLLSLFPKPPDDAESKPLPGVISGQRIYLGFHQLRLLHAIISYKEKMFYATAADAH